MATAITSQTKSTCPTVSIAVSSSSVNGGTQRYSYTVKYNTYGYTLSASSKPTVTAKIGSTTVCSSSITVGGKSTYTIKTGSIDVRKGTSATNLAISISIAFGSIKWGGTTLGTRSGSSSISLPAKTSYSVSYNANGGSGAPGSQTKWYNTTLTLSSTKPTRTGYTFSKWNTASGGTGTNYSSGASYTTNAGATLYAQWTANTYTITLNSNGGTGGTSSVTKTYDQNITLPSAANSPTRTSYKFLGWAESPSSQSAQYKAGSSYTKDITANTTLYAIWELMYLPPSISNLQCYRSDVDGNLSDEGSYGCVKFNWKVDQTIGTSNVMKSLTISADDDVKWSATPGGASGTVSQVISGLDTDKTYTIKVVLKDTYTDGTTITQFGYIDTAFFTIDVKAGGKGIAFGKAAEQDSRFDLAWNMVMDNGSGVDGSGVIYGRDPSTGEEVAAFQPQNENGNTIIGHGNFARKSGNTNIYAGPNIHMFGMGNTTAMSRFDGTTGQVFLNRQSDVGFMATHATSGKKVGCGVGSGGDNRGLHDPTHGSWIIHRNSSNTTVVTTTSDARFKDILGEISDDEMSSLLNGIKPINFVYKDDENKVVQNGFIAQNVRDVLIENDVGYRSYLLINKGEEEFYDLETPEEDVRYGLDYSKFTPILVAGWQHHEKKIKELENKISSLEAKLEVLENDIHADR